MPRPVCGAAPPRSHTTWPIPPYRRASPPPQSGTTGTSRTRCITLVTSLSRKINPASVATRVSSHGCAASPTMCYAVTEPAPSVRTGTPPLCRPVLHHRNQRHEHRQIDLAAEKSQRGWRRAAAAPIDCAAEAKPTVVLFAERDRPPTRLARIVRCVQYTAALRTAGSAALRRQITVECQQLLMKLGIRQQGLVQRRPSFPLG